MTLLDLEPKWINDNIFIFLCPHCKSIWISCKNIIKSAYDQYNLFMDLNLDKDVVPCKSDFCWVISCKEFNNITVTPSIDASASGHWHGHITNGQII